MSLAIIRLVSVARILRTLLRLAILATSFAQIAAGDVMYGAFCLAALGFTVALARFSLRADRRLSLGIDLLVLNLMVLDMTLGNLLGLYVVLPWYDKALHLGSSVLIGLLGFLSIYMLHATGRTRFRAWLDGIAILLVTLGLGALWEIGEYGVDQLFGRASQGSPVFAPHDDTMIDMILDAIGGAVVAVLGPLYIRRSARARRELDGIATAIARVVATAPQ